MTHKTHPLYIPIYDVRVNIVFCENVDDFLRDNDLLLEGETETSLISCVTWVKNEYYVVFPLSITNGLIAHELFHLTHRILEGVGVEFSTSNHEPFAYLIEYLTNELNKVIQNDQIQSSLHRR